MKKYFLYVGLIMISLFGTDLTDFALSIWVLKQPEGTITSYTMIWFFEAAPAVFLAPFIGSFVDRWSKKKIIIYGQIVAGVGSVLLMLLHYLGQLEPWHIMVVSGIGSVASMFVFNAFYVTTRALVPTNKLMKAQGMSTAMYAGINMGVPIIAPVLYRFIGIGNIFLIDVITFLISIITFLTIRFVLVSQTKEEFSMRNDWVLVKEFLSKKMGITYLLLFLFITNFFTGLIQVLFTPLLLDFSNEYVLGIVLSVIGIGSVLGGIIISNMRKIKKPISTIFYTMTLVGSILCCLWIDVNPYVLAIGGMFVVLLFTISDIMNDTFFQVIVPVKMLGRLSGFVGLIVGGAGPLAFLLSGFLVDHLNGLSPKIWSHLPGTEITTSIMLIFTMSGVLLMMVSILYSRKKELKKLDFLYKMAVEKESELPIQKKEIKSIV